MIPFIIIVVCAIIVAIISYILICRSRLKDRQKEVVEMIDHSLTKQESYQSIDTDCNITFSSISYDIKHNYIDHYITSLQQKELISHYRSTYVEAQSLSEKLKRFSITPSESLIVFIDDYNSIRGIVKSHNEEVISSRLKKYSSFFDSCLTYPLDNQQRRSIVSEAQNCLVVSSAGSGKTSSIVGKVKYLTEIKKVDPSRILLISYTNKAASELTERINTPGLRGYTFHKLALDIIGEVSGIKPSICQNTDALFVRIFRNLLQDELFKSKALEYFVDYQYYEKEWEAKKREKRENLTDLKSIQIKALLPDMDGNIINVKSVQEQKICFALSSLGVNFRYEEKYEYELSDEKHSQYSPDFSIYFYKSGQSRRIYLEHFGVDEHGLVPHWFADHKNISYDEANNIYNDGITWKIETHKKFATELLTTSSADFHYLDIKDKLKDLLKGAGVPIVEKSQEELYDLIISSDTKREKSFIRLIATFITLTKSSCMPLDEIIQSINNKADERSLFIIKDIIHPIYNQYIEALRDKEQIDFTDAILKATQMCYNSQKYSYDYIIVDEFQDISIDRYNFLKALRQGYTQAKLYCVGDDWQSIYRFSGSDMSLFNQFEDYFGETELNRIETTYRFGEPLVAQSSQFIQRNSAQIRKNIRSFNSNITTELEFRHYYRRDYCNTIEQIVSDIPQDKSIYLLGRYTFDDYYLSYRFSSIKRGEKFFYNILGREIEFLTVHKSKGLEADYVILLQCNKDTYGFPSLVSDDPILNYVLTQSDRYPFGEERRLFYVAITRAKIKTIVLYDNRYPSVFVDEFISPETISPDSYIKHRNANKRWTPKADKFLLDLHNDGKTIKFISQKMGRSQTSIIMRLETLNGK
ncbi:MAG: UvrD-helicase domain-containing protein [Bacteroidales bacterium]